MTQIRYRLDRTTLYFSQGIYLEPDSSMEKIDRATQFCMSAIDWELIALFKWEDLGRKWNVTYTRQFAQPIGFPPRNAKNDNWTKRRLSVSAYVHLL